MHYKILQKSSLYILFYFIFLLYMIYSTKQITFSNYLYLDNKTFIENIMRNYCKSYYVNDYNKLYKQRFYDSNVNKYIIIMYITNKILKSDFLTIFSIYNNIINIDNRLNFLEYLSYMCDIIKPNKRKNYNYQMMADFIFYIIEDNL